jgi:lipopolysaccharide export system permease protein
MDSLELLRMDRYRDVALFGERQTTLLRDTLTSVGSTIATRSILELLSPTQKRMAFDGARSLCRNTRQGIANAIEDADSKKKLKDRHAIEWHRKFFLATSCLLLFFIGAPLGAIIRKGGLGMPTVLAILIFLGYYILSIVGEQMIRAGKIPPVVGMWMSSAILLPGAIYLTRRAVRDAHVFAWSIPKWRRSRKAEAN